MRLLNARTFAIHECLGDHTEEYAILSHTWGEEECTFQDVSARRFGQKGFSKIKFCCEQAVKDGLDWVWVDTCCIDKTNAAELSEAINSMFRWYSTAKICYAYLADVTDQQGLASSRWFNRGWTLQELIAPKAIHFYSSHWMLLGSKLQLQDQLQEATGIDTDVLSTGNFRKVCVARRMSWAARRSTTRIEDQAYSLMGIFDVNMPLIYGEGEKAFLRLQQEILRVSDDDSLFAWGAPDVFLDMHGFLTSSVHHMHGLFADSPEDFDSKHEIQEIQEDRPPLVIYGNGVRLQYPVCMKGPYEFVIIACTLRHRARAYISVPVKSWGGSFYARCGPLVLIFPEDWTKAQTKILVVKQPPFGGETLPLPETFRIIRVPDKTRRRKDDPFILDEVYCLPHASYIPSDHSIAPSSKIRGPQAALFFTPSAMLDKKRQSLQGEFPLHCFAIVLGYSKRSHPWGAFVPILRKSHVDADFHEIIRSSTGMARHCMTRTQLKDRLRRLDMLVFPRANSSFKQLLSVWAQPWRGNVLEHRNLELSVHLKIERINLVDDAIFVCIDFYEVSMGRSTSKPIFRSFEDTADEERSATEGRELYFPDWLTMDQLEWFIDRVPWKSAG